MDATHDPQLRSWLASANSEDTDFPLKNLPFGRFRIDLGEAHDVVLPAESAAVHAMA
jgi:hypothetical protein